MNDINKLNKINIQKLISNKNIPLEFFDRNKDFDLLLESNIDAHVKKAFDIYRVNYPGKIENRAVHGIAHVTRVLTYIHPIYNFFKRYDKNLSISDEDLKLLELAGLFHDSGRENDGIDLWEHDSATLFYYYLTKLLGVTHEKAKFFSEIILNKDYKKGDEYHFLYSVKGDEISWAVEENSQKEKTIYHKLLHDADCLDIIRARDRFDASYLDFYNDFVKKDIESTKLKKMLPMSLLEMGQFIAEARSLIEYCGNTRYFSLLYRQNHFNQEDCYAKIQNCIKSNNFPLINYLVNNNDGNASIIENIKGISYRQPQDSFNVFRGIRVPSGYSSVYERFSNPVTATAFGNTHSNVNNELVLAFREKGIMTEEESGNKFRSVSLLEKSGLYTSSGFLCSNQSLKNFSNIFSNGNAATGVGQKEVDSQNQKNKENNLYDLIMNQCMGGVVFENKWTHTELLINQVIPDGVVYTLDPTITTRRNFFMNGRYLKQVPLLEAIYLHAAYAIQLGRFPEQIYNKNSSNLDLPIYKYSGIHNTFEKVVYPSNDEIVKIWEELFNVFFKSQSISKDKLLSLSENEYNFLKVMACYYKNKIKLNGNDMDINSLDYYYPDDLKRRINEILQRKIELEQFNFLKNNYSGIENLELLILQIQFFLKDKRFENNSLPEPLKLEIKKYKSSEETYNNRYLALKILHGCKLLPKNYVISNEENNECFKDSNLNISFGVNKNGIFLLDYEDNEYFNKVILSLDADKIGSLFYNLKEKYGDAVYYFISSKIGSAFDFHDLLNNLNKRDIQSYIDNLKLLVSKKKFYELITKKITIPHDFKAIFKHLNTDQRNTFINELNCFLPIGFNKFLYNIIKDYRSEFDSVLEILPETTKVDFINYNNFHSKNEVINNTKKETKLNNIRVEDIINKISNADFLVDIVKLFNENEILSFFKKIKENLGNEYSNFINAKISSVTDFQSVVKNLNFNQIQSFIDAIKLTLTKKEFHQFLMNKVSSLIKIRGILFYLNESQKEILLNDINQLFPDGLYEFLCKNINSMFDYNCSINLFPLEHKKKFDKYFYENLKTRPQTDFIKSFIIMLKETTDKSANEESKEEKELNKEVNKEVKEAVIQVDKPQNKNQFLYFYSFSDTISKHLFDFNKFINELADPLDVYDDSKENFIKKNYN